MSSLEKPGFFSKLFGLNVSRPTASTDNGPSPSSNGSSLSSHEEHSNTNGSSPAVSKSLRYLSPTAIENSFSRVSSRPAESTSDTARKRPLESPQATSGIANGSFYMSDAAKRFRGSAVANTSLITEPVTRLDLPRLDTTWCAGAGVVSPTNLSYSPCSSVRSLRSRITRPSSRTSVLSSKTAALLGQIEKVSTPAQDARRMPMLRVGLNKERWNTLGPSANNNPPLNRLSSAPSRYQVMSSFLTPMQKKPYWRDVARERTEEVTEEVAAETSVSLPITTRSENGEKNGVRDNEIRAPALQPVLKGCDGSNVNRERNRFSANEIASEDDSLELNALNNVKGLDASQFVFALPTKGFLAKDVKPSFSFKKPVKVSESMTESDSSDESESEEAESSGSDSGSGGDDESDSGRNGGSDAKAKTTEKTSDTSSSAENTSKETSNEESKKNSSPATAINTIANTFVPKSVSVAEPSKTSSPALPPSSCANWDCPSCCVSNKEVHSKCVCCGENKPGSRAAAAVTSGATWDCPSCCVNNKAADSKCVCCGENKPGVAAPLAASMNVFGDRAFKPSTAPPSSGFSFGFGGGSGSSSTLSFGIKPSTESAPIKTSSDVVTTGLKPSPETVVSSTPPTLSIPSITVAPPPPAASVASKPLFGGSSTTIGTIGSSGGFSFGVKAPATNGESGASVVPPPAPPAPSMPLFSSAPPAPTTASLAAPPPLFALAPVSSLASSSTALPSLSSAPSLPLFGSSSLSTAPSSLLSVSSSGLTLPTTSAPSIPLFGAPSTTSSSTLNLFGAPSTGTSLSASTSIASGSSTPSLAFSFGASGSSSLTKAPLFGSNTEVKSQFGSWKQSEDEGSAAKRSMMGAPPSTITPFAFGGQGQKNTLGSANLFGSSSTSNPFGGLTQSASAPSFSLPTAPPASFNFGSESSSTLAPPSTFNFGGSSSAAPSAPSASSPFVFGSTSSQPAAPSFGSFGGAPPAAPFAPPPDASNPFAFNSSAAPSGSRKMIQAKRRLPGKR